MTPRNQIIYQLYDEAARLFLEACKEPRNRWKSAKVRFWKKQMQWLDKRFVEEMNEP